MPALITLHMLTLAAATVCSSRARTKHCHLSAIFSSQNHQHVRGLRSGFCPTTASSCNCSCPIALKNFSTRKSILIRELCDRAGTRAQAAEKGSLHRATDAAAIGRHGGGRRQKDQPCGGEEQGAHAAPSQGPQKPSCQGGICRFLLSWQNFGGTAFVWGSQCEGLSLRQL